MAKWGDLHYEWPFYENCICCNGPAGEYIVWWNVWSVEANLDENDGQVCPSCLEYRIGRPLTPEDFVPLPATVASPHPLVLERVKPETLKVYSDGTSNADETLIVFLRMKTIYRSDMFDWYWESMWFYDLEALDCVFEVAPGREDDTKEIFMEALDFPLAALPTDGRGIYKEVEYG